MLDLSHVDYDGLKPFTGQVFLQQSYGDHPGEDGIESGCKSVHGQDESSQGDQLQRMPIR